MEKPIQSFQDLSLQTDMLYGTVSQTSIHDYLKLKANQDDTSQWSRLWKVVNSTKISTAEEGFKKVHEQGQKFAFLWDVAIIEYKILTDEDCSLTTVKVCLTRHDTHFDCSLRVQYSKRAMALPFAAATRFAMRWAWRYSKCRIMGSWRRWSTNGKPTLFESNSPKVLFLWVNYI